MSLCVTGNEASAEAWSARVHECDRRCARSAVAPPQHELRIDAIDRIDDSLFEALRAHADRAIACCRPVRQGGRFAGDERDRLALLGRAAKTGARWLDLEADVEPERIEELRALCQAHGGNLLLSWHDFEMPPSAEANGDRPSSNLTARVGAMTALRPAAIKLAAMVSDASQILELSAVAKDAPIPRVVIAMGAAGLVSRTHYAALGSMWSYVAARAELATAPGQLDLETALAMGMPATASGPLCGLLGAEQVMRSPGRAVYNRLFRARGDRMSYVPVVTRTLASTLPLIEHIGARGLSITMPLKLEALSRCRPDDVALETGAVNSLRRRSEWQGTNTDVEGIRAPLAELVPARGLRRAVILGAGGAARAAAVACRRLGLRTEVCARKLDAARDVAGPRDKSIAWDERARCIPLRDAVLINATPICGDDNPWPEATPLDAAVVFDTAIGPKRSALLARARTSGAIAIDPMRMWLAQGAAQMSWFLDEPITSHDLELFAS